MANWRKTRTPGRLRRALDVGARPTRTPTARCRCKPSWRGRRAQPGHRQARVAASRRKDRGEVLVLARAPSPRAPTHLAELADARPDVRGRSATSGSTASSRAASAGAAAAASRTPTRRSRAMRRSLEYHVLPGVRRPLSPARSPRSTGSAGSTSSPAQGLSRSTIAKHVSRRLGHLRLGRGAEPPPRPAQPAAPRRAPAERREAAAARRARARGGGAARRPRARGPPPLRDRLLRRSPPLRDLPPRMARRPRRRPHRDPDPRPPLQERRRHRTGGRRSPTTSARSSPPPGSARAARAKARSSSVSVMSGKIADARRRRLGRRRPQPHHAPRVPPHLRLAADGGRLHDQGAHGVHGPRRPADGQPLREAPPAARRGRRGRAAQRLPPTLGVRSPRHSNPVSSAPLWWWRFATDATPPRSSAVDEARCSYSSNRTANGRPIRCAETTPFPRSRSLVLRARWSSAGCVSWALVQTTASRRHRSMGPKV